MAPEPPDEDAGPVAAGSAGIVVNACIAVLMTAAGIAVSSAAMVADAASQLSEVARSVVSYSVSGSGRLLRRRDAGLAVAFCVSVVVIVAGALLFRICTQSIVDPDPPEYTLLVVAITAGVTAAKIVVGRHYIRVGRTVGSEILEDSGRGSIAGSALTAAILLVAVLSIAVDVSLDAYLGAAISALIIIAGARMAYVSFMGARGLRTDEQLDAGLRSAVSRIPAVGGVSDLVIRRTGRNSVSATVYIDAFDSCTSSQIEDLEHRLMEEARRTCGPVIESVKVRVRRTKDADDASDGEEGGGGRSEDRCPFWASCAQCFFNR